MENTEQITKEIKIRGVPKNTYDILVEMQKAEKRPSLNNFLLVKLIEMANEWRSR